MSSEHQYLTHTMPCCKSLHNMQSHSTKSHSLKSVKSMGKWWRTHVSQLCFSQPQKDFEFPLPTAWPMFTDIKANKLVTKQVRGKLYSGSFLAKSRALLFPCTAFVTAVSATNWRKGQARTPSFKALIPSSRFLPIWSSSLEKRQCYEQRLPLGTNSGLTHEVGPTFPSWHLSI